MARPGQLRAYRGGAAAARRLWNGLIASLPVSAGAVVLDGGPADRRRLFGRLAVMFFVGGEVLGLVRLPVPTSGSDAAATAVVCAVALGFGLPPGVRRGRDGRSGPAWRLYRPRSP